MYPPIGSVWRSKNRHSTTIVRVIGITPAGRVKAYNITRGCKQHRHRVYTVPWEHLSTKHERIK